MKQVPWVVAVGWDLQDLTHGLQWMLLLGRDLTFCF